MSVMLSVFGASGITLPVVLLAVMLTVADWPEPLYVTGVIATANVAVEVAWLMVKLRLLVTPLKFASDATVFDM